MEFKRARTKEQKQQRMDAILNTADRLLDKYNYKEITMAMIAEELGFSRANLAHYVQTKEEIFLLLYMRETELLFMELTTKYKERVSVEIPGFAEDFADICAGYKNFCRVGAILYSIIEANIRLERLIVYKKELHQYMEEVAVLLPKLLPFLTHEDAMEMVMALVNYIVGLYPSTNPTEIQGQAMAASGFDVLSRDFRAALKKFIMIQLYGYQRVRELK